MRVRVEMCHNGFGNYHARCTVVDGRYAGAGCHVVCEDGVWTRAAAVKMRDHFEYFYGVRRNSIKVEVV